MIYVLAEVMPASIFARLCKILYTKPMLTWNCSVTRQSSTSGTECHTVLVDRESNYKRLSQLALDLVASPASQAYVERLFSLCGDLTAKKEHN